MLSCKSLCHALAVVGAYQKALSPETGNGVLQVGKDRQRARQTDALAMAQQAYADEAPSASPAVGSVLESGIACGTTGRADDHADDAATPGPVKHEVQNIVVPL